MRKNLEQIRAQRALEVSKDLDRKAVNKIPALIINNGLLAAAAYSCDGKREEMGKVFDAVFTHLINQGYFHANPSDKREIFDALSKTDENTLQRGTLEALEYLGYLKRFAEPKKEKVPEKEGN